MSKSSGQKKLEANKIIRSFLFSIGETTIVYHSPPTWTLWEWVTQNITQSASPPVFIIHRQGLAQRRDKASRELTAQYEKKKKRLLFYPSGGVELIGLGLHSAIRACWSQSAVLWHSVTTKLSLFQQERFPSSFEHRLYDCKLTLQITPKLLLPEHDSIKDCLSHENPTHSLAESLEAEE